MSAGVSTRAGMRWSILRIAACVILAAIGFDLLDSGCDAEPSYSASSSAVREQGQGTTSDPCAPVCVPDCFCCSRSVVAGPVVPPPSLARLAQIDMPAADRWSDGVRPVVDHPPLARG